MKSVKKESALSLLLVGSVCMIVGCATLNGAVQLKDDGSYESTVSGSNETEAKKLASQDLKKTCKKKTPVVSDQVVVDSGPKNAVDKETTGGVAKTATDIGLSMLGLKQIQLRTIFRCS